MMWTILYAKMTKSAKIKQIEKWSKVNRNLVLVFQKTGKALV